MLPHRFPFRLVDRREGERARVALSGGAFWSRGGERALPESLLVEVFAQAAAAVLAGRGAPSGQGYLAGVEGMQIARLPEPGERVLVDVRLVAGFGRLAKVEAELTCDDERLASATLLLAAGA